MGIRPDVVGMIAYLNRLAALDVDAMAELVTTRVPCNKAMHADPYVQTVPAGTHPSYVSGTDAGGALGLLGVLNGYYGTYDEGPHKGWGAIGATFNPEAPYLGVCFQLVEPLPERTRPALAEASAPRVAVGDRYRHNKSGREYVVTDVTRDEETLEVRVSYRPASGPVATGELAWNRLESVFLGDRGDGVARFTRLPSVTP